MVVVAAAVAEVVVEISLEQARLTGIMKIHNINPIISVVLTYELRNALDTFYFSSRSCFHVFSLISLKIGL